MEFCDSGDLTKYLKKNSKLTEQEFVEIFCQILSGMKAFFKQNILHRDLKTDNILMNQGSAKIADLGFAKQL